MKKNVRLLVMTVVTATLIGLLCGCGGSDDELPTLQGIPIQTQDTEPEAVDARPDEEEVFIDYEGKYEDENCNTVTIKKNDDGTYYIDVSLYRLADFEDDKAVLENQAIWFSCADPAGGATIGSFHLGAEDTYVVEFHDINWEYIASGDVFYDFRK